MLAGSLFAVERELNHSPPIGIYLAETCPNCGIAWNWTVPQFHATYLQITQPGTSVYIEAAK
jgi:hypothetical protein